MTDFVAFNPLKYTIYVFECEIWKNIKKRYSYKTFRTHCDICFAKMGGGLCPAAAEHPLLCVQKKSGVYHHFLM